MNNIRVFLMIERKLLQLVKEYIKKYAECVGNALTLSEATKRIPGRKIDIVVFSDGLHDPHNDIRGVCLANEVMKIKGNFKFLYLTFSLVLEEEIRERFRELGFDHVGMTDEAFSFLRDAISMETSLGTMEDNVAA